MFEAHSKRVATERALATKDAIVSGMWANTNLDHENARKQAIDEIDEQFDLAIMKIYHGEKAEQIDTENPFFAAMQVPVIDQEVTTEQVDELSGS